jgi:O-acetyl-ADP-ribose deacetylase
MSPSPEAISSINKLEKKITENSIHFDGKTIFCRQGDITGSSANAIVNAANNHLWMGGGVAGAIKRKGGQVIEDEATKKGPIEIGQAVSTGAGKLKAEYVIHAAVMGQDLRTNADYIRKATQNSLKQAEKLHLDSIDFPALGTGVGGFSIDECAKIMLAEALLFSKNSIYIKAVGFVLFDEAAYQAFVQALNVVGALP